MATGRIPTTANSPLTTKGDLFGYSTTQARVAVGSDGETLVADSAASVGLRYQANFAAGKNKIINGDFYINQRAFSSTTTAGAYGFDRWYLSDNTTMTYSAQNFTAGTAPVAGYEGKSFARSEITTSSAVGEYGIIIQPIEDVRTFAGQTVTVSLWAKAASGTPKLGIELYQSFGSGGSSGVSSNGQSVTISTSWARYSVTISVPSISGKTIGTGSSLDLNLWFTAGSNLATRSGTVGNQSATIDVWGVQVEAGSVATAFQTATGTLQGELAACQRYFQAYNYATPGEQFCNLTYYTSTAVYGVLHFPVTMRVAPTLTASSTTALNVYSSAANRATSAITGGGTIFGYELSLTTAAATQGNGAWARLASGAYIYMSSEL